MIDWEFNFVVDVYELFSLMLLSYTDVNFLLSKIEHFVLVLNQV